MATIKTASPSIAPTHETRLWGLGALSITLEWLESLLNLVNGPVLLFGAGIALVDLLTDGQLTATVPLLLYAWAISQAVGVDVQLLGCFARARGARGWQRVGWLILGGVLGFAAWQAGDVFAIQQSEHITEAAALAQLGMPPALWLGWRAFLAVGLVALSGWTRYRAPVQVSTDEERAALERQLELEPLRAQVRQQKVKGWRDTAASLVTRAEDAPTDPDGGTPVDAPTTAEDAPNASTAPRRVLRLASGGARVPAGHMTAPQLVTWLKRTYDLTVDENEVAAFVRNLRDAYRLEGVRGKPWTAAKPLMLARAREKWAPTIQLEAAR